MGNDQQMKKEFTLYILSTEELLILLAGFYCGDVYTSVVNKVFKALNTYNCIT